MRSPAKKTSLQDLPPSPTPLHFYSQLTVRERRFVDGYVTHLDMNRAARDAGYEKTPGNELMRDERIRCAVRERTEAVSQLAGITAADLRRELKQVFDADPSELSGIHKVPCRHCHGMNGQYQYTDAEMRYVEQAHAYGETGWPHACITSEFGSELYRHAHAAYLAGKSGRTLDIKGGDGYTRNAEINPACPQCCGDGIPMAYVCDTRHVSEAGKRLLKGVRFGDNRFEVLTIDRNRIRDMLARDLNVGVERKELVIGLPRNAEEFRQMVERMPVTELEEFIANMVTLGEDEYAEVGTQTLPAPGKVGFRRGR